MGMTKAQKLENLRRLANEFLTAHRELCELLGPGPDDDQIADQMVQFDRMAVAAELEQDRLR